jgi:hypothetical protein
MMSVVQLPLRGLLRWLSFIGQVVAQNLSYTPAGEGVARTGEPW